MEAEKGITLFSKKKRAHYKTDLVGGIFISDSLILAFGGDNIYQYNKERDTFEEYGLGGEEFRTYDLWVIRDIMQINETQYLLATIRGLHLWNKMTNIVSPIDELSILNNQIQVLFKFKDSILVGTDYGLYAFDIISKNVREYIIDAKSEAFENAYINHIISDNFC